MIQFGVSPALPVTPVYHRSNKPIYPHRPIQFGLTDALELTTTKAEIREERYTTAQGVTVPLQISSLAPSQFVQDVKDALDQVPAYILGLAVDAGYSTRIVRRLRPEELPSRADEFPAEATGITYHPDLIVFPFEIETEKGSNKYYNLPPLGLIDTIIHENLHAISFQYGHLFPESAYYQKLEEPCLHSLLRFRQARNNDLENMTGRSLGIKEEIEVMLDIFNNRTPLSAEEKQRVQLWWNIFSPSEIWARAGSLAVRLDEGISSYSGGFNDEIQKSFPQSIDVMREFYLPFLREAYEALN